MLKAGLILKEVEAPIDHICRSGHEAPHIFCRNGPGTQPEPTKFFEVFVEGKNHGIFCEPCLMVANFIARKKKI
jgi:hypothetical protein